MANMDALWTFLLSGVSITFLLGVVWKAGEFVKEQRLARDRARETDAELRRLMADHIKDDNARTQQAFANVQVSIDKMRQQQEAMNGRLANIEGRLGMPTISGRAP